MTSKRSFTTYDVIGLLIFVLCAIGYVRNIIDLVGMDSIASVEGALRIIGIFVAHLGVIMGLFI